MEIENKNSGGLSTGVRRIICYIVLIFLTFLCLFFFYVMIINATRTNADIQKGFSFLPGKQLVANFKKVMENSTGQMPMLRGLLNSLIVAGASCLLTTYFSSMTAYAIHCYDFKLKKVAFTFILMIMMVPTQVTALGFVRLMGTFHLTDSFWPLIIPSIAAPIVFFFMKQFMDSALPLEIVEAARIDGSNEFKTFNRIVIPIMKPAIAVQAIFAFTSSWNNYFLPSLLITKTDLKTVPIIIALVRNENPSELDLGKVYMMILMAILPIMIVYIFLSKSIVEGVAIGSVKG